MKKSLLALAVTAAAAVTFASAASAAAVYDKDGTSLDVYGRVQSVIYNDEAANSFDDNASMSTSARFGLDMRTNLTTGIDAFAKAEWDAATSDNGNDEHFSSRDMYVGVDFGQFGAIKFGKFDEAIKFATSHTDIFEDFGCVGLAGNDDRHQSMIGYTWSGYGVDVNVNYSFAKKAQHVDAAYIGIDQEANLENTVSGMVGYTTPDVVFGPINVAVGFSVANFADNAKDLNYLTANTYYDQYTQFGGGLSWGSLDVGPYIAAVYQQRKFDYEGLNGAESGDFTVAGYEFAVGYGFANGLSLRAGYATQNIDYLDYDADTAVVDLFVNWQINSNFNVWIEAGLDADSDDDKNNGFKAVTGVNNEEDKFGAGIRYTF